MIDIEKFLSVMFAVGLILVVVIFFLSVGVCFGEEKVEQKIITKEYVAQYIGKVVNIAWVNDREEFNRITMRVDRIEFKVERKFNRSRRSFLEIERYYVVGESEVSYAIKIEINKIRTIK